MKEKHSGGLRILLTGRDGQVGRELSRSLAKLGEVTATSRDELDLTSDYAIGDVVHEVRPQLIVNAAAYTAVDKAESEPDFAHRINAEAVATLAAAAKSVGAAVIHYSTDYVFDGSKETPYVENDRPHPLSVYGKSKLDGEKALAAAGVPYLILRTSWVYGGEGKNFLLTILRLAMERRELHVVNDQIGAPTWSRDLAKATASIVEKWHHEKFAPAKSGVYHIAAAGKPVGSASRKRLSGCARCLQPRKERNLRGWWRSLPRTIPRRRRDLRILSWIARSWRGSLSVTCRSGRHPWLL